MKTKFLIIIATAFFTMSYTSTSGKNDKNNASNNNTSISLEEQNCDIGFYNVLIEYRGNPSNAHKAVIRARFDIYGRSPISQAFPDGSERWVFILQNMDQSAVNGSQCRSLIVRGEIENDKEVILLDSDGN